MGEELKMELKAIQAESHQITLRFRSIDNYLTSTEFLEAYRLTKSTQDLVSAIQAGDLGWIKDWARALIERELGDLSLRQLREKATELGIRYVTSYSKDQLLVQIFQVKHNASERIAKNTERVPHQHSG